MGSQRISVVSDQANGFGCSKEKTDNFVVDIESFSHLVDKDSNHSSPNSRITWQRNLSRKGSPRGAGEKRPGTSNERDGSLLSSASSSPKAVSMVESNMAEVLSGTAVGTADNLTGHHQITITAGSVGTINPESKWNNRRLYSFRRPPPSWAIDPRKILFFFATLSSMGTILLIFLTLSMRNISME